MKGKTVSVLAILLITVFFSRHTLAESVKIGKNNIVINNDNITSYKPGLTAYSDDYGLSGSLPALPGYPVGVFGSAYADNSLGSSHAAGVMGVVSGRFSMPPTGYGVYGRATNGYFMYGCGVYGESETAGVYGISRNSSGYGGYFINDERGPSLINQVGIKVETFYGNLIEGWQTFNQTPYRDLKFYVSRSGDVHADGSYYGAAYNSGGADVAESVILLGDKSRYKPGEVLVISTETQGGSHTFARSDSSYATNVAGIYSTKPGFIGQRWEADDPRLKNEIPMAVVGIVPCLVSAENGPIQRGDLLVSSTTPGHAMMGTDRLKLIGAIVGKALGTLEAGLGQIDVLVALQ